MSIHFEDIERQAKQLSLKQKAALVRTLIEELDSSVDRDVEQIWIEEVQRRYDAYLRGELEALPGEEVMERARARLK